MLIGVCRIGGFGFDFKNAGFTQKGLFTTSAVDNIDHNPSATTATISCHGTGISVFQHPVSSTFSDSRTFEFKGQKPKSKAISCLPETYTNVKPAFLKSKPNLPILQTPMSMFDLDYLVRNLRLEYEWLQFVSLVLDMMLLLAPMMSSVGPKLRYLFPNPTWKVMVKLATYIATAPKYVLLARQIF
jgi:hypothetical protein